MTAPTALSRARLLAVALVALVLLVAPWATSTARAVGVAGVELEAELPRGVDGRLEVAVGTEKVPVRLWLSNIVDDERTVRLYVVGADVPAGGSPVLTGTADAPFITLADQTVTLAPGERRTIEAWIDPALLTAGAAVHHAGFVVESSSGDTLVTRAASVIRIVGQRTPLPMIPFMVAALMVVGAGAMTRQQQRRQRLVAA